MTFDWDIEKDAANQAKHGASFDQAKAMILGPDTLTVEAKTVGPERRWTVIAPVGGRLWSAFITYRGDVTRIISFRPSNAKDTAVYEQNA